MLTKKVWERTRKTSHFETASNSFQSKTWKRCVPNPQQPCL